MASISVQAETEIAASVDTVFDLLTDPARMSEWVKGVESGHWLEGNGLETGGRFSLQYHYGRKTHNVTMQVVASDRTSRYEFKTVEGPYPIEASFNLKTTGRGTAVSYHQRANSDSKLAAMGFALTGWIARPMMRRMLRQDLGRLESAVTRTS